MSFASRKLHLLALLTLAALVLPALAVACGGGDDDENGGTATPAAASPAATGAGEGDGGETTLDMSMHETGGNVFELGDEKNPTLTLATGDKITINLVNDGVAIHNMRFAGEDNKYDTSDDAVSDPALVTAGQEAVLTFTAPAAGTYNYRCDFHPTDMLGIVEIG